MRARALQQHGPCPPRPAGRLSEALLGRLTDGRRAPLPPPSAEEPLSDTDFQLALYVLYELHYRGFARVDEGWEWDPDLLAWRGALEAIFERALFERAGAPAPSGTEDMDLRLRAVLDADDSPSLSRHLETRASLEQFREFVIHRSAYQLKEADPHSWAVPRLAGAVKAALLEVQFDEYGEGRPGRMHSELFAGTMRALGLDPAYGAHLDLLPGCTLATVNLMSFLGLHRRWRGAIVGHLAAFEMSSSLPNRRYSNGLLRLGAPAATREFYDVHVIADAVHENVAAVDMAGGLAHAEPDLAGDILFGARALVALEADFARHLLESWEGERGSLREPSAAAAVQV